MIPGTFGGVGVGFGVAAGGFCVEGAGTGAGAEALEEPKLKNEPDLGWLALPCGGIGTSVEVSFNGIWNVLESIPDGLMCASFVRDSLESLPASGTLDAVIEAQYDE